MKKARVWMFITGCMNLLEVALNAVILLDRNGYLVQMVDKLANSDAWVDVEFAHHMISLLLLTVAGERSAIHVLRKNPRKERCIAVAVLILIPLRIILHHFAMKQFVWIP